mmetsp:Transcript_58962/g.108953  ORF Transcript_58962/g.108953 Transcript_58962/m.108953 type:complete len:695 (-) Transcript_58962:227-2311(-)
MSSPRAQRGPKKMILRPGPGAVLDSRRSVRLLNEYRASRREREFLRDESPPPPSQRTKKRRDLDPGDVHRGRGLRIPVEEDEVPFQHMGYRAHPELSLRKVRRRRLRAVGFDDEDEDLPVPVDKTKAPWRVGREPDSSLARRSRNFEASASPPRFAQETDRVRAVASCQTLARRARHDQDPMPPTVERHRDAPRRMDPQTRGPITRVKRGMLKRPPEAVSERRKVAAGSRSRDHEVAKGSEAPAKESRSRAAVAAEGKALRIDSSPSPRRIEGDHSGGKACESRRAQPKDADNLKKRSSSSSSSTSSSSSGRRKRAMRSRSRKRAIEKRLRSRSRQRAEDRRPLRRRTRSRSPVFSRMRQINDGPSIQQQRAVEAKLKQIAAQQPQGLPFWKRGKQGGFRAPFKGNPAAAAALPAGLLGGAPRSALGLPDRKPKLGPGLQASGHPDKYSHALWEEPRGQTGLRLIGEMCVPDGSVPWEYILQDESRRCYAGFRSNCFTKEETRGFFENAKRGTKWYQPTGPAGSVIPRKTAWLVGKGCQCAYRYGQIEVPPQEFPPWMTELMQMVMPFCGLSSPSAWPTCCNVNLYEDGGMSVGWHADDERLFQGKFTDIKIISLSLGAKRKFELRANWPEEGEEPVKAIFLQDGDLLTMEGMLQKHYQHRVPKEGHVLGPRINLTWRWILSHTPQCPAPRARR